MASTCERVFCCASSMSLRMSLASMSPIDVSLSESAFGGSRDGGSLLEVLRVEGEVLLAARSGVTTAEAEAVPLLLDLLTPPLSDFLTPPLVDLSALDAMLKEQLGRARGLAGEVAS